MNKNNWNDKLLRLILGLCLITILNATVLGQERSTTGTEKKPELQKVLILGDSISIGYTATVRAELKDVASVFRPTNKNNRPENCAGTKKGVAAIDRWLKIDGGEFDVIHFNFGLHDLKRVNQETGKNSNDPADPRQSEPDAYEKQLREIVKKLKSTGAVLVFATTTPVPKGVRPLRDTTDPQRYNGIAKKIMDENKIAVNDLFAFAEKRLDKIQQPANVHFSKQGSQQLGKQVAAVIRKHLKSGSKK